MAAATPARAMMAKDFIVMMILLLWMVKM